MSYKHILVAVDLSKESNTLVKKAVSMAKPYNSSVSLIHVDVYYPAPYTGFIDINFTNSQKPPSEEILSFMNELSKNSDYPISETLSSSGDLCHVLVDAINKYHIDLVLCGHHQDFWSKLISSARQIINKVPVDILIVPLNS